MKIKRIPDSRFTNETSAGSNRVFLLENSSEPPYLKIVSGWEIVGYGNAPWPSYSDGFAVMLEKVVPAETVDDSMFQESHVLFEEGTWIWHHIRRTQFQRMTGIKKLSI